MDPMAITMTILAHPLQVLAAGLAALHAVRAILAERPKRNKRPVVRLAHRPAA